MDWSAFAAGKLAPLAAFLTSLAIGLLIGAERERNPSAKAGVRTFALTSVFGTLAALSARRQATRGGLARHVILPAAAPPAGGLAALLLW